jgi:hypothetical protein
LPVPVATGRSLIGLDARTARPLIRSLKPWRGPGDGRGTCAVKLFNSIF